MPRAVRGGGVMRGPSRGKVVKKMGKEVVNVKDEAMKPG